MGRFIATVGVALIAGIVFSASAQETDKGTEVIAKTVPAFQCLAETEGQLTCQAGRQCRCVFKPAVKSTGLPDRWAWDCGIMRPACEVTPAELGADGVTIPAVIVERDRRRKNKKDEESDPPR